MTYRFASPELLVLLLLVPVIIMALFIRRPSELRMRHSSADRFRSIPGVARSVWLWIPSYLRIGALICVILAAARPQQGQHEEVIYSEGIDAVIALDISGSMRALDFKPTNRLEVAKQVISDFISKRETDRIGLVLFGSESFTLCPLTLDHDLLLEFLKQAQIGMVEEKTAIGKALANAVNRLRTAGEKGAVSAKPQSQIVILVTDGVNTVKAAVDPLTAAQAAASLGIKVYTIGVGTNGMAEFPHPRIPGYVVQAPVELDEDMLKQIAQTTGGQYFPARNSDSLKRIFETIDQLEKVQIESLKYERYRELFHYPLWVGLALLVLETVLAQTRFRRIP